MKTKVIEYVSRMQDGGAETIVKDYALLLDKEKFDVTVVCEDYKKNSANYRILKENNVKTIYLYGKFDLLCRALQRIFGQRFISLLFNRVLKDIKPDIIHVQLESLEVLYHSRKHLDNVKLFFTCQNLPELKIGEKRPKERDACRYLLDYNNLQIFALHDEMAKEINERFNINNTIVLKNGIDFDRFRNVSETKEEIRESIGIPKDAYLVGHVGRFHYQKNHELLIKVFNDVVKKKDNAYLLLIGAGNLEDDVRKQISDLGLNDRVVILSHRKDIPRLMKSMDVFLFPSRYEGLGIVLIEAQISGLPCVISNTLPHEAYQSKNITELALDAPIDEWSKAVINPVGNITKWGNINDYDMKKVIKKLERYYNLME